MRFFGLKEKVATHDAQVKALAVRVPIQTRCPTCEATRAAHIALQDDYATLYALNQRQADMIERLTISQAVRDALANDAAEDGI